MKQTRVLILIFLIALFGCDRFSKIEVPKYLDGIVPEKAEKTEELHTAKLKAWRFEYPEGFPCTELQSRLESVALKHGYERKFVLTEKHPYGENWLGFVDASNLKKKEWVHRLVKEYHKPDAYLYFAYEYRSPFAVDSKGEMKFKRPSDPTVRVVILYATSMEAIEKGLSRLDAK